jgi:beta-glucosidase
VRDATPGRARSDVTRHSSSQARRFPEGFLWGCSTAAHQVEGGNHGNDWWRWEQRGRILTGDSSDPACDSWRRYAEDSTLLREIGNNAHRMSIEWSRVEPAPGQFDQAAIDHYRDVLLDLRAKGMTAIVTLHHFSSPLWFADRGGWAASGAADAWLPFVRRVAGELGELVGRWCTINEPNIYAYQGWVTGEFPPGRKGDLPGLRRVLGNLRTGHLAALKALGELTPDVPAGLSHHKWIMVPQRNRASDRLAADIAQGVMDRWPNGVRMERVVEAPGDFIGLNHYTGSLVRFDMTRPQDGFIRRTNPAGLPVSDFGWAVNPHWMRIALRELQPLGKPVYITESGIATRDDNRRQGFLRALLHEVWEAIQEGVDVRGYLHWTAIDNFEWAHGYAMRFGLIGVDRATQARTIKPSGRLFGRIASANALPEPDPRPA